MAVCTCWTNSTGRTVLCEPHQREEAKGLVINDDEHLRNALDAVRTAQESLWAIVNQRVDGLKLLPPSTGV